MKLTLRTIGFIICTLLTNLTVNACSCRHLGDFTQEEFNELGAIFTGQVVDEYFDTIIDRTVIKFQAKQLFKGQSDNGYIYAINSPGNCRIHVEKGEYFLFFLYGKVDKPGISMCSRKIRIKDIANFTPPDWLTKCADKPDGLDKSYYSSKKLASEGRLVNQKPEGFWKYYHKNGLLTSTGFYKNGLKDSLWTHYDFDGKTLAVISYKKDKRHGKTIRYHDNGSIEAEELYLNGLEHGYSYGLYEDGTKRWEAQYENDKSVESSFYYENGNKETYRIDTLESRWYENGNRQYERYFKNGKNDYQHYWWENGQLKQTLVFNENKEEIVVYAAKENGEVMVKNGTGFYDMWGEKGEYKDSLRVGTWRQEFNNGTVEETNYKGGIKDGTFKRWNKDGTLIFEGAHKNGEPSGLWRFWYDSGQIRLERKWEDGENIMVNSWNPDGNEMVKDGTGTHVYYDDDGTKRTWSPTQYKNGKSKK